MMQLQQKIDTLRKEDRERALQLQQANISAPPDLEKQI